MTDAFARLQGALQDRYRLERELGQGGMATVYLAEDLKHHRKVALKVLRPELAATLGPERFLREIQIAAQLQHPNILAVHDSGEAAGFLYYVMPFVEGHSLRERLEKEGELPVPEAARILRDVADALSAAHEKGVVHRDIKPENVLLTGRHALVADFGVAKAVSEATGRQTLTTAGVALGTPTYMAPEQAAASPHIDARADLYALGVMAYEMLTGQPPFSAPTPQALLAAHVTEPPLEVTQRRATIPAPLAQLIMRCLAKKAADRPQTADELLPVLESFTTPSGGITPTQTQPVVAAAKRRRLVAGAAIAGVAVMTAVAALIAGGSLFRRRLPVTLGARTQLTFTGNVLRPTISRDGKDLAFWTKTCTSDGCTYALQIQDVGARATHRVLDGATAGSGIQWSMDRRFLLVHASIGGRLGSYVVSALGGSPRYVSPGEASFLGSGDSLLIPDYRTALDTVFWLQVQTLDGATRDSVRVTVPTPSRNAVPYPIPGTRWIMIGVWEGDGSYLFQVVDRHGRVADRFLGAPCTPYWEASEDALWFKCSDAVMRVAFDAATGRLSTRQDTVCTGLLEVFSVTADGGSFVTGEGTTEYSVWALDLAEALRGHFPESRLVLRATSAVHAYPSPDGSQLLLERTKPGGAGQTYAVRPYAGGAEQELHTPLEPSAAWWSAEGHILAMSARDSVMQLSLVDIRSGAVLRWLDYPESTIWMNAIDALPDGWVYLSSTNDRVVVVRGGQRRVIPKPQDIGRLVALRADSAGQVVATAFSRTEDSLLVLQVPTDGSAWTVWAELSAEAGYGLPLSGGGVLITAFHSPQSVTVYSASAPGRLTRLGTVPRPVDRLSVSRGGRRVAVQVADHFGDAWMSKVVRP